jgi:hypothetical protein
MTPLTVTEGHWGNTPSTRPHEDNRPCEIGLYFKWDWLVPKPTRVKRNSTKGTTQMRNKLKRMRPGSKQGGRTGYLAPLPPPCVGDEGGRGWGCRGPPCTPGGSRIASPSHLGHNSIIIYIVINNVINNIIINNINNIIINNINNINNIIINNINNINNINVINNIIINNIVNNIIINIVIIILLIIIRNNTTSV